MNFTIFVTTRHKNSSTPHCLVTVFFLKDLLHFGDRTAFFTANKNITKQVCSFRLEIITKMSARYSFFHCSRTIVFEFLYDRNNAIESKLDPFFEQ